MDLRLILTAAVLVSAEREHHLIHDFLEEYKYYQGSQVLELSFQKASISVSVKSLHVIATKVCSNKVTLRADKL